MSRRSLPKIFRAGRPAPRARSQWPPKYRLIGIGLSELSDHRADDTVDLLDPALRKRAAAERASDAARAKFGKDAVVTGRAARIAIMPAR
jgi:DNA polymerase-4